MNDDIPNPIDLRRIEVARQWADSALAKRPWRTEFFETFAAAIGAGTRGSGSRVLELGSGPCFLAEHLLRAHPALHYTALDFSAAMHELAAERLGKLAQAVRFVERSFRDAAWSEGLGPFDFVVTHQAVHELRHKRHATALHAQVKPLLAAGGSYLVCDHFAGDGGMADDRLYMSIAEQKQSLTDAGYRSARQLLCKGGLVLHQAA